MTSAWWEMVGVALAVLGLALISLIEAALISMDRVRLRQLIEQGHPTAPLVERLMARPDALLGGVVVMVNVAVLLAATLTTLAAHDLFGPGAIVWANLLVLVLLLLFGAIVPRTLSLHYVEPIALRTARLAYALNLLLQPLVAVLSWLARGLLRLLTGVRLLPGHVHAAPTAFSVEDIKQLLTIGELGGEMEAAEREMISGAIEFAETTAGEIMVPRTDMVALEDTTPLEEAIEAFVASGHSRIPVYSENADNILGLLYIKDLLIRLKTGREAGEAPPPITALLRPAFFVPESKKSDELLRELQRRRVHLAIVVDEYGGTAGIITIEDLLEEIVGDIIDEYDQERDEVVIQPDGTALVEGRTSLEKIEDLFDMPIPETEAETISGLITELLGRIPELQDRLVINGVEFTVLAVDHNRAEQLRAAVLPETEAPPET